MIQNVAFPAQPDSIERSRPLNVSLVKMPSLLSHEQRGVVERYEDGDRSACWQKECQRLTVEFLGLDL